MLDESIAWGLLYSAIRKGYEMRETGYDRYTRIWTYDRHHMFTNKYILAIVRNVDRFEAFNPKLKKLFRDYQQQVKSGSYDDDQQFSESELQSFDWLLV